MSETFSGWLKKVCAYIQACVYILVLRRQTLLHISTLNHGTDNGLSGCTMSEINSLFPLRQSLLYTLPAPFLI